MSLFRIPWNSLKTRVTLLTLAIFLISLWSMLWYASQMLRRDLIALLSAQQFTSASVVASEIDDALNFRIRALTGLARRIPPDLLSDSAAVQSLLDQHPIMEDLFNRGFIAVNAQGSMIAEIPRSAQRVGINVADREYFQSALTQGKPIVSQPLVSRKSPSPIVVIAVPILDAQGRASGVLAGVIDLRQPNFLDRITENRYGKTGETFLVTPQTRMIVSTSDKSRIMEVLPAPGTSSWIDRFMQGYEGSAVVVNPHGQDVLVSVRQIPIAGWYASVILPTREA
ncbi:cache domain-containing protein, partial [uncultured Thiocystis sp.]|uniref:cache domain-containing protein n=1 Tax=uncultured Thiocystis sp. TaxID=1202134 RepID=UPI0025F1E301